MLLYRGSRQAPRKYPVQQSAEPVQTPTCPTCRSSIWNSALLSGLRTTEVSKEHFTLTYTASATALAQSAAAACQWCTTLANGIYGRVYLDRLYEQWNSTDSDVSCSGGNDASNDEDPFMEGMSNSFDPAGLDADDDVDVFAVECDFSVRVTFQRNDQGSIAFLDAHVESVAEITPEVPNMAATLRGETTVDLRYSVSLSDQASAEDGHPTLTLGSPPGLRRLKTWMGSLPAVDSQQAIDIELLPSRLIAIKSSNLHLVNTSDLRSTGEGNVAYVALSYVWGTNQSFILLHDNESQLRSSFSIGDVPKTIQDAVAVTCELGFQYLWVDALCIVQDSNEDKQRELPKMGSIYQQAALTLVAAAAKSALEGFLHIQEQHLYHIDPIYISLPSDTATDREHVLSLSSPADYKRWKDPINGRGWTFQEFILSSAIAFFSYRGIEMIDRRNQAVAKNPVSELDEQLPDLPWMRPAFTLAPNVESIREVWLSIRGEYTQRQLGYQQDKLPAISAIAQEIGRAYKSKYLAGLWERDLADELKWCHADIVYSEDANQRDRSRRMPRTDHYIAPSWSWASVNGPIDDYTVEGGVPVKDWLDFKIIRCDVIPTIPGFEYGAVTAGELVVSGRMHSFFYQPHSDPTVDCDGFLAVKTNEEPHDEYKVGEVIVDCDDPSLVDGCVVDCLAMSLVERIPGKEEIECLVLLPAEGEGKYRRVGFGKVSVTALYDDPDVFEICIV